MAKDRLPVGLTLSMIVGAVSVAVLALSGSIGRVIQAPVLVHTSAALALIWSLAAYLLSRRRAFAPAHVHYDATAVLQIATMLAAEVAVLVMLYAAVLETLRRTVFMDYLIAREVVIWRSGLIDLLLVGTALGLHWARTRQAQLLTAIYWVLILAAGWGSLLSPGFRSIRSAGGSEHSIPTAWASLFMLGACAATLLMTVLAGWMTQRRRARAWPDNLEHLTEPATPWPGFHSSAAIVGVAVLCLGCVHVIVPWTPVAAAMAGGSLLALAHRRWNEVLADAAFGLITLAVVSACMFGMSWPVWTTTGYASIFNRAVLGFAVMTIFWHWLAAVWEQQLDEGRPWTTAGRLIRVARRVGFLSGAAGLLMSLHLAFWPSLPYVIDRDASRARWIWGPIANGLLVVALLLSARLTRKSTLAWLTILALGSTAGFVVTRAPGSALGELWFLYWPALVAASGVVCLLGILLVRRARPYFVEPLLVTGVLLAPVLSLMGLSIADEALIPHWLPPLTFATLAMLYLIASRVPGPRTFAAVAVICMAAAAWSLRTVTPHPLLNSVYFHGVLAGAAVALVTLIYSDRISRPTARAFVWGGTVVAAASLIANLLAWR